MTWLWVLVTTAWGQDAPCDAAFDINRMIEGMNKVDAAFEAFDAANALVVLRAMRTDMACLRDTVHPHHLVRFARQQAMAAFFDQDELELAYWAQLALVKPELPWPASVGPEHPVREQFAFVDVEAPVRVSGGLSVPKGGAFLIDGWWAAWPEAAPDAPHFVQVLDRDGGVVASLWQDGVVFREAYLRPEAEALPEPRGWVEPDPQLDPTEPISIDPVELARRRAAREAAELALAKQRERTMAALEKERERAEKRAAKLARKGVAVGAEATASSATPPAEAAPTEWVALSFDDDKASLAAMDAVERGASEAACDDLQSLEPRALIGRLTDPQTLCLELRLRREDRLTMKNKVSRLLMADSWAKKELDRWEGAVQRHLEEIDRSDPDLAAIYARFLAQRGLDQLPSAIRWANLALQNAHLWEGEQRVERVLQLHRVNAVAAKQLWLAAEDDALRDRARENLGRANFWRNQTKNLAREWLSFAVAAGRDPGASLDLCVSAAGTADYCQVR